MDSADVLRFGLDVLGRVVASAPDSGWDAPTPCEGWTARHLAGHLVQVLSMSEALCGGNDFSWAGAGDPVEVAGKDPAGTVAAAIATVKDALPNVDLEAVQETPMGEMPIGRRLSFPAMDTHLHSWDLSRAWGRSLDMDPEVIAFVRAALEGMPDTMLRSPQVFGPVVEPPADATPTEELMAFLGRDPRA
ncbi:MAG TPA: TIGR03086 family metal-binding protein [Mycobacteriales bacterium]|nr:TIGR03086 family metal-binding protein [Mycobacteriales bacterium]